MRETAAFKEHGVAFTIATDGPEMMRTHLRDELELLERIGALSTEEIAAANRRGHEASCQVGSLIVPISSPTRDDLAASPRSVWVDMAALPAGSS